MLNTNFIQAKLCLLLFVLYLFLSSLLSFNIYHFLYVINIPQLNTLFFDKKGALKKNMKNNIFILSVRFKVLVP